MRWRILMFENSIVVHKSKPPLRWIANWAGTIASSGILDVSYMEEDGYTGWRYKLNLWKWDTFWPIYNKYGTFYILDTDMSGKAWDDYDENGIPYWEKTGMVDPDYFPPWDFEDAGTGDAFRVVRKR